MFAVNTRHKYKQSTRASILRTLVYFDLFNYPLSCEEIHFYSSESLPEVEENLQEMVENGSLFFADGFYMLRHDDTLAGKRQRANELARPLLDKAYRIGAFLYRFPFVRGVAISGSLSKNCATEKADIDFFIITKSNRLWIARTLMHLFKKFTYLTGSQHYYCMNYYVDEQALQIEEKNIYTATEMITLVPACGNETIREFYRANNWVGEYFSNYDPARPPVRIGRSHAFKRLIEFCFDNRLGNRLDDYFMRLTDKRWKHKENKQKLNINGTRVGLKTGKHFSKPNPIYFQDKLLRMYEERMEDLTGNGSQK